MPGFCGSTNLFKTTDDVFLSSINLLGNLKCENLFKDNMQLSAAYHKNHPLQGNRIYDGEKYAIVFAGDLIDYKYIPYDLIIDILESKKYSNLNKICSRWAFVSYNKNSDELIAATDRRSLQPIYYYTKRGSVIFSTDLASFFNHPIANNLNNKFIYEYLFFDFSIDETTFLEDVHKLPHSSVLTINLNNLTVSTYRYDLPFSKSETLKSGEEAKEYAYQIFRDRIGKCYQDDLSKIVCALTAGWDARTVLAFAPTFNGLSTYTYGMPQSGDLRAAEKVAKIIETDHVEVILDTQFENSIPNIMLESLYLSSGSQRGNRASLLHVYQKLTDMGSKFPIVLSGHSIDTFFRGHTAYPALASRGIANILRTGDTESWKSNWHACLHEDLYQEFCDYIKGKLSEIEGRIGRFNSSSAHLGYMLYYGTVNNFLYGEIKIADYFTTVRAPGWDDKMAKLAFSIDCSTLGNSLYMYPDRGAWGEVGLQSYIIQRANKTLSTIPAQRNILPWAVNRGFLAYILFRTAFQVKNSVCTRKDYVPMENFKAWFTVKHLSFTKDLLLAGDSKIHEYIPIEVINNAIINQDMYWVNKFLSLEIILRLIGNGWKRFW